MQLNIILLRRRARVDLSAASRCTPLLPEKKIPLSRTHRQLTTKTAGAIGPNHWSRNCGFELVIIIPKVTTWSLHVNSSIKSYWVHIRVRTIIGGRRWSPMPESVAQQTSGRNSTLEKKCTATKYTHVQDAGLHRALHWQHNKLSVAPEQLHKSNRACIRSFNLRLLLPLYMNAVNNSGTTFNH